MVLTPPNPFATPILTLLDQVVVFLSSQLELQGLPWFHTSWKTIAKQRVLWSNWIHFKIIIKEATGYYKKLFAAVGVSSSFFFCNKGKEFRQITRKGSRTFFWSFFLLINRAWLLNNASMSFCRLSTGHKTEQNNKVYYRYFYCYCEQFYILWL